MTPEENKQYDDYCNMFATSGWVTYIKQLTETREATLQAAPYNASDNNTWQYARGMLAQMDSFLGFEAFVHAVHDQTVELEAQEAEDNE